jgi:hypothetical protein
LRTYFIGHTPQVTLAPCASFGNKSTRVFFELARIVLNPKQCKLCPKTGSGKATMNVYHNCHIFLAKTNSDFCASAFIDAILSNKTHSLHILHHFSGSLPAHKIAKLNLKKIEPSDHRDKARLYAPPVGLVNANSELDARGKNEN